MHYNTFSLTKYITYFDDISFDDVINKSDKSMEWDTKFKRFEEARKAFQEMKVCN